MDFTNNSQIQDLTGQFTDLNSALLQDTSERIAKITADEFNHDSTKLGGNIDFSQGLYNPIDNLVSKSVNTNTHPQQQSANNPSANDDPAFAAVATAKLNFKPATIAGSLSAPHKFDVTDQIKNKYIDQYRGYMPNADNEELYARDDANNNYFYNKGKHFLQFAAHVIPSTVLKAVDMIAATGSTIIKTPYILSMAYMEPETSINVGDNAISTYVSNLDKDLQNKINPIYQSLTNRNAGFWSRAWNDPTFYTQDLADGVAFFGAAFLTSALTQGGGLTGETGLMSRVGRSLAGITSNIGKSFGMESEALGLAGRGILGDAEMEKLTENYIKNGNKFAKMADFGTTTILNTLGESSMEARDSYTTVKQQMLDNGYSVDEAEKMAHQAYKGVFGANLVILGISNGLFETGIIRGSLANLAGKAEIKAEGEGVTKMILDKSTGKLHVNNFEYKLFGAEGATTRAQKAITNVLDGRIGFYGSEIGKGVLAEGIWEENMQLAAQRYFQDVDHLKGKNSGILSSIVGISKNGATQLWNSAFGSDTEAGVSIGLGGLIGAFGIGTHTATSKLRTGKGQYSTELEHTNKSLTIYNQIVNQTFGDLYQKDDKGKYIKNDKGELQVDDVKMAAFIKDHADRLNHLAFAEAIGNDTAKRIATKSFFANFINQFTGSGIDPTKLLEFKFEQYRKAGDDTLKKLGFKNQAEFNTFTQEITEISEGIKDINKTLDNDIKFSQKHDDQKNEQVRRSYLVQNAIKSNIYAQEMDHFQKQLSEYSQKVNTNPIVDQINHIYSRLRSNKKFLDEPNFDVIVKKEAQRLQDSLEGELKRISNQNEEMLQGFTKDENGYYDPKQERSIYQDRYDKINARIGEAKNLIHLQNKEFYKYAASKDGMESFGKEVLPKILNSIKQGEDESAGENTPEETNPINPNAKRTTITTKDKAGKEYSHELIEGETYLTDKDPQKKFYRGKNVHTYNHDTFKVHKINDDGTIVVEINNSGESVTLDPSELSDIGKIWSLRSMSPLLQNYFKNRDNVFELNLAVFTNKDGSKFVKPHRLDNKNYNLPGASTNMNVNARLGLRKDSEGKNVIKIIYKDPFTGKQVAIDYNQNYLKKYGSGKTNILDFIDAKAKQALQEQEAKREAKRQTQLTYLNQLIDDASVKLEAAKQRSIQNERSVTDLEDKVSAYEADLESLMKLQQEIVEDPRNQDKRTKDKLKKEARQEVEKIQKKIKSIENDIAEAEKIIESLKEEHNDIQKQIQIHEAAQELYFEYGLDVEASNQPLDLTKEGLAAEEGYLQGLQDEDNRNSAEKLQNVLDQTKEELNVVQGKISKVKEFISILRKMLNGLRVREAFLEYLSGDNKPIKATREAFRVRLQEITEQLKTEEDPEKIKDLNREATDIQRLRLQLSKDAEGEKLFTRLGEIRNYLQGSANELSELNDAFKALAEKRDRLMYAIGVKEGIINQTAKISAYKELQAQFMQKYKQELIVKNAKIAKNTDTKVSSSEEYENENSTEAFEKKAEDRVRSKPPLNNETVFKTTGRHYNEDNTLTDDLASSFFYFTSEVMGDSNEYSLLATTAYHLPISEAVKGLLTKEQIANHIPLIVVKKVGNEFKPVGINGEVLTDEELKDPTKFIQSAMHNDADLISGDDRRIIDWARKAFDTSQMKEDEILKIAKNYLTVKNYVQEQLNKGESVPFKIAGKRPGVTNKSTDIHSVEGIFMGENPSSEDFKNVDLKVITTEDTGGTNSVVPKGGIVIIADGFANKVLDRNLTDEELTTVANAIFRVNQLMGDESIKEEAELQAELTNLRTYLRGVTQWSVPKDGEKVNPQQVWLASGLHMGDQLLTPANMSIAEIKAFLQITDANGVKHPIYHATNKKLVGENKEFVTPSFDEVGVASFDDVWNSYKEYLLSTKDGRVAPLQTNVVKPNESQRLAKRRNVQLLYISPIQQETKSTVTPTIEQNVVSKIPWSDVAKKFDSIKETLVKIGLLGGQAGDVLDGVAIPKPKEGEYYKIFVPIDLGTEENPEIYNHNSLVVVKNGKFEVVSVFVKRASDNTDVTNNKAELEKINKQQPLKALQIKSVEDIHLGIGLGLFTKGVYMQLIQQVVKAGVTLETKAPEPTLEAEILTEPIAEAVVTPETKSEEPIVTGEKITDFASLDLENEETTSANDTDNLAYRLASPKETSSYTTENVKEFQDWLEKYLPQVKLLLQDKAIDGKYGGQFLNGAIKLYRNAEIGTGFHEAFEAVYNAMLSPSERKALIDEFKSRSGAFEFDQHGQKTTIPHSEATTYQAKETLAEEFRAFMLAKKQGNTNLKAGAAKRNNFFIRLWNTLKDLFSKLTGKDEKLLNSKIDNLFKDISEGKFKEVDLAETFIKNNRPILDYTVQQSANIINALHSAFFRNLIKASIDDPEIGLDTLLSNDNAKLVQDVLTQTKGTLLAGLNAKINSYKTDRAKQAITQVRDTILNDKIFNTDIWPLYKEFLKKYSLAFEQEAAQENEEQKDGDVMDKSNLQESVEVDSRNLAKGLVKILLASLPDVHYNNKGQLQNTIQKDTFIDYNKNVNYGKILATLINDLSNIVPSYINGVKMNRMDLMFNKLDDKYKTSDGLYKRGFEWIAILKSRLAYSTLDGVKLDPTTLTEAQVRMKISFESSFSNTMQLPTQTLIKEDGDIYFVNAVVESNKNKIRQNWLNNTNDPLATAIITKEGARVVDRDKIVSDTTFASKKALLESLGIQTSITEDLLSAHKDYKRHFENAVASIKHVLTDTKRKYDIKVDELFGKQLINKALSDIADIEAAINDDANIKMFRNAEGRMEYSIVLPSTYSSIINSLSSVKTIDDFMKTNPQFVGKDGLIKVYQKNSFLLNKILFDSNGKRTSKGISIYRISGMKSEKENDGLSTKGLSFTDKFAQEANHIINGKYYVIINSDKSSEFALDFGHFVDYGFNVDRAVREYLVPHLVDEITPIINYWKDKSSTTNVQYYIEDMFYKRLGHFADKVPSFKSSVDELINSTKKLQGKNLEDAIYKFALSKEKELKEYFLDNAVTTYQDDMISKGIVEKNGGLFRSNYLSKELLRKYDINPLSMTKAQFNLLTQFIVFNSEIAVAEQHKLVYGDPRLSKDLAKRASAVNSTREIVTDNSNTLDWMNKNMPRLDGKERKTDKNTINVISYADTNVMSNELVSIAEDFFKEFTNRKNKENNITREQAEKIIGAKFTNEGRVISFNNDTKSAMAPYFKLTENDGQAYIMSDFYRDLLFLSAKLSHEQNNLLDYLSAYERLTRSKWNSEHEFAEYRYIYTNDDQKSKDEALVKKGQPDAILPTLKPQGFTYNANSELLHTTFLKNSVTPLFFKHLEARPLAMKQYLIAQANQVDIVGTSSGEKMGYVYKSTTISKDKKSIEGNEVANFVDGKINNEVPPIQEVYTEYFGLQVEMAPKTKKQIIQGSQITKLILSNIFEHGQSVNAALETLTHQYLDNLKDLIDIGRSELMKKIGLIENADGSYQTDNVEALVKTLREEAISRDMPDNVLEIFEVDPKNVKQVKYRFDASPTRDRIEYMLMAMIDRSVISQKLSGKMSAQVSSTIHNPMQSRDYAYLVEENGIKTYKKISAKDIEKLSDEDRKTVRMTSTDLAFYVDGRGMEVELPWYYAEKLGIKEGDMTKIDPKLLRLIGYRIPTQSLGQAEYITIKRFLPKELGDIIVVPTEIVGKSGSDFDIDKLSIYTPNFYKHNGELKYLPSDPDEAEKIGEKVFFHDQGGSEDKLIQSLFKNSSELKEFKQKYRKMALENKNIELMWDILSNSQNRRQHLTANNADSLKTLEGEILSELYSQDEVNELTGSNSKTSLGQLSKMAIIRNIFLKAKQLVGIGALQITSHTISQLGNITLTGHYKDGLNQVPVEIQLDHNKNQNGQYSLAHVYSKDGKYISEILSEFLSGFVDAAKDPFIFNLNINLETAPTWFMLLKLSVPLKSAAYFMNQPSIRTLIAEKDKEDSLVKNVTKTKRSGWKIQRDILSTYYPEEFGPIYDKRFGGKRSLNWKEYDKALTTLKNQLSDIDKSIFDEDELKKSLSSNKTPPSQLSENEKLKQVAYLLEYGKYANYSNVFSKYINSLSVDTYRAKTLAENSLLLEKRNIATESEFISNIDDAFNNTFLSKLYEERKRFSNYLNDKLVIADAKVQNHIYSAIKYISQKQFISNEKLEKFMNRYQSFILSYIAQNTKAKLENGTEIKLSHPSFYNLFRTTDNNKSLVTQMNENKYIQEQIKNKNAFFEAISILEHGENSNFDTIRLNNNSLDTYGLNNAAGQLNDFYNKMMSVSKTGDAVATDAASIIDRLVVYSLLQSGLQVSPINFSKLLHQDLYVKFVNPILNEFVNNEKELDPYVLWKQFHQNNWNNPDIVDTHVAAIKQGTDFNFIDDETGENANDFYNAFDRYTTYVDGNTFVTKIEEGKFVSDFIAASIISGYAPETGKGGRRVKNLYELYEINKDTAVYKKINKLGDRMFMMETYSQDTKGMTKDEIYTSSLEINPLIEEPSHPSLVENKLKELTYNELVSNNNSVPLQELPTTEQALNMFGYTHDGLALTSSIIDEQTIFTSVVDGPYYYDTLLGTDKYDEFDPDRGMVKITSSNYEDAIAKSKEEVDAITIKTRKGFLIANIPEAIYNVPIDENSSLEFIGIAQVQAFVEDKENDPVEVKAVKEYLFKWFRDSLDKKDCNK